MMILSLPIGTDPTILFFELESCRDHLTIALGMYEFRPAIVTFPLFMLLTPCHALNEGIAARGTFTLCHGLPSVPYVSSENIAT
jgi:hypothetical protein